MYHISSAESLPSTTINLGNNNNDDYSLCYCSSSNVCDYKSISATANPCSNNDCTSTNPYTGSGGVDVDGWCFSWNWYISQGMLVIVTITINGTPYVVGFTNFSRGGGSVDFNLNINGSSSSTSGVLNFQETEPQFNIGSTNTNYCEISYTTVKTNNCSNDSNNDPDVIIVSGNPSANPDNYVIVFAAAAIFDATYRRSNTPLLQQVASVL